MIEIRKALASEMGDIIRVANQSFAPEREAGFDFKKIQPKAYADGKNTADRHILLFENEALVSLAGNLHHEINLAGNKYPYSFLGTVSTLPEYRGKGYMRQLMQKIEEEDRAAGVIFSALTGKRKRYNRFGYEKCSSDYAFSVTSYCLRDYSNDSGISIRPYETADLPIIFPIYKSTQPYIVRAIEDFVDCLSFSSSMIFTVLLGGDIVGYLNYCARKNGIFEIALTDMDLTPAVLSLFMRTKNFSEVTIHVNPLNYALINILDGISESKALCDDVHLRVYDKKRFLELLISLNLSVLPSQCEESFVIDGMRYVININGHSVTVNEEESKGEQSLSMQYFLRNAIGDGNNALCRQSRLLPLSFGFNNADTF